MPKPRKRGHVEMRVAALARGLVAVRPPPALIETVRPGSLLQLDAGERAAVLCQRAGLCVAAPLGAANAAGADDAARFDGSEAAFMGGDARLEVEFGWNLFGRALDWRGAPLPASPSNAGAWGARACPARGRLRFGCVASTAPRHNNNSWPCCCAVGPSAGYANSRARACEPPIADTEVDTEVDTPAHPALPASQASQARSARGCRSRDVPSPSPERPGSLVLLLQYCTGAAVQWWLDFKKHAG